MKFLEPIFSETFALDGFLVISPLGAGVLLALGLDAPPLDDALEDAAHAAARRAAGLAAW